MSIFKNLIDAILPQAGLKIDDTTYMRPRDRDSYLFVEGDHKMIIETQIMGRPSRRLIFTDLIRQWLPPHEGDRITEVDKARIISKVCHYFDIVGKRWETEEQYEKRQSDSSD